MSLDKKRDYLKKFNKKELSNIVENEKTHLEGWGITIDTSIPVQEIRTKLEKMHLNVLGKYARKKGLIYSKYKTGGGRPILKLGGRKFIVDPRYKGGVRRYTVKKSHRQKQSEKMKQLHAENKIQPPASTPCKSIPKCTKKHASKEEAEFCYQLSKIIRNQPSNWQYTISNRKSTIYLDYFLNEQIAIEYHPPNFRTDETNYSYTKERRQKLDEKGLNETPLIVIPSLNNGQITEQIFDNTWIVFSLSELSKIIQKLFSKENH